MSCHNTSSRIRIYTLVGVKQVYLCLIIISSCAENRPFVSSLPFVLLALYGKYNTVLFKSVMTVKLSTHRHIHIICNTSPNQFYLGWFCKFVVIFRSIFSGQNVQSASFVNFSYLWICTIQMSMRISSCCKCHYPFIILCSQSTEVVQKVWSYPKIFENIR